MATGWDAYWAAQRADITHRQSLRERERAENVPYVEEAKRTGRPVTFIASDGCAVTAMPDGSVLFNAADWF
jgi:hypothetical protein